jgi:uncharacterized membrane protein
MSDDPTAPGPPEMASVLRRNIEQLAELRRAAARERDLQTRIADAITGFAGSMRSICTHASILVVWLVCNAGLVPGVRPWDPYPFVMLAMMASVEAIFLSTFVLISQNRMAALGSRRDELDVQISLLAEHEITRVIQMLDATMRHLQVPPATPELEPLKQDVDPRTVVEEIARTEQAG